MKKTKKVKGDTRVAKVLSDPKVVGDLKAT